MNSKQKTSYRLSGNIIARFKKNFFIAGINKNNYNN